jgi:hypothetical protein
MQLLLAACTAIQQCQPLLWHNTSMKLNVLLLLSTGLLLLPPVLLQAALSILSSCTPWLLQWTQSC